MINSSKSSEGFQSLGTPHKLLTEEKVIFDFIESMNEVMRLNKETHLIYFMFLLDFTDYQVEPHAEAFIRRAFNIINNIILKGAIGQDTLAKVIDPLYEKMRNLIELRYNSEACMTLIFSSKGS